MALADPQSVTIDGTAFSLPRLPGQAGRQPYTSSDGMTSLVILQSNGKRKRSAVRIEKRKVVTDPITGLSSYGDAAVYVMFDRPLVGFSNDELAKIFVGLSAALTASTNALTLKVLGGEQ